MHLPHTPFTFDQALDLGFTPRRLRDAVSDGTLRRVLKGVYADAALPDDTLLRARAAALVLPVDAVVSDRSAAWLHGVDAFEASAHLGVPRLEVVSAPESTRVRRAETLGGRRDLRPDDVMRVKGVPVTTPLRTACDLGRLRGRSAAFGVLCMLARSCGVTREAITAELSRYRGMRGVTQLRALAPLVTPKCESPAEAWTLLAIVDAGLPVPEAQVWIELPGFGRARVDLAYRLARVAVEYDGEEHHSSDEDRAHDEARRDALHDAGWTVVVVRRGDFTGPALDGWLGKVREALRDRRPPQRRDYARAPRLVSRPRPS